MYDVEQMITDLKTLFQNNLNTKIAAINTEKSAAPGDVLYLEDIPTDTYVFQALSLEVYNFNTFLLYGLSGNPNLIDTQEDNFIDQVELTFEVTEPDRGFETRETQIFKLLRYARALRDVVINNIDVFQGYAKPKIIGLTPAGYYFDGRLYLSCGIKIAASITAR